MRAPAASAGKASHLSAGTITALKGARPNLRPGRHCSYRPEPGRQS
jgi:hypothetical protein